MKEIPLKRRDTSSICKHISRLMGNDHRSPAIIKEIQDWYLESGPEWTVDRLKNLKQFVLRYISDEKYRISKTLPELNGSWYARKKNGWPKGPVGNYIQDVLTSKNMTKKLGKLLSVLQTYSGIISPAITNKQRSKFTEAISGRVPLGSQEYGQKIGKSFYNSNQRKTKYTKDFHGYYNRFHKFNFAGLNTAKPTTTLLPPEVKHLHPWVRSLIEGTVVRGPWTPILKSMGVPLFKDGHDLPKTPFGGVISVIQEGGYKARVICMPVACAQIAFKPLHDTISTLLKNMREDCTHDQGKGVKWARNELRQGKTVHAVDLSSATDNFPLSFQLEVLKGLGYEYTNEFQEFCKLKFGVHKDIGNEPLSYTKGQPMGLFGSFALFAFSHHILLQGIEAHLGKEETYRILGDDIVISDDNVHSEYLKQLSKLGVPISHSKCLSSSIFSEFAGKVITTDGSVDFVKAPKPGHFPKKGSLKRDKIDVPLNIDQFINYCKVLGSTDSVISGVPKKYREKALQFAALPEQFGGAGVNPKGISLRDRVLAFVQDDVQTAFPLMGDIQSSLIQASVMKTHVHVNDVCSYVNDQLNRWYSIIEEHIKDSPLVGLSSVSDPRMLRSLVSQLLDSSQEDNSVTFAVL